MAIHAVCKFCGHKMNVPDKFRGKKVSCTGCGRKTRVLTALELSVEKASEEKESRSSREKPREPEKPTQPQQAPAPKVVTPPSTGAATRYPALRTLRAVFTFFAYLVGVLGVAVGILLFLWSQGPQEGLLLLLGFFVGGAVAFCLFKLLAEAARLGADLGDMESRMLELLLDMRDKLGKLRR